MPYESIAELPETVRDALPAEAQRVWLRAYNSAAEEHEEEGARAAIAWSAVQDAGWEQENDQWVKKSTCFSAWRCHICNYVYLGYGRPDRCPHCGTKGDYLHDAKAYTHIEAVPLSEQTRERALEALELEATCEAYYRCCEETALSREAETYFRRLARHEAEHKETLARLLGVDVPALPSVDCPELDAAKFILAAEYELKVIAHYKDSLAQATEPRAQEVFSSFLDVEKEHKELALVKGAKASGMKSNPTAGDVHVPTTEWDRDEDNPDPGQALPITQGEPFTKQLEVEFVHKDDEKRLVTGIVLEPDTIDAHGDIIRPEEIEQAAHKFLAKSRVVGRQHRKQAPAEVVESYLAPEDMTIGGQSVKQGTWIMTAKIHDDKLWGEVKDGELTGFSIGAYGIREPAAS